VPARVAHKQVCATRCMGGRCVLYPPQASASLPLLLLLLLLLLSAQVETDEYIDDAMAYDESSLDYN